MIDTFHVKFNFWLSEDSFNFPREKIRLCPAPLGRQLDMSIVLWPAVNRQPGYRRGGLAKQGSTQNPSKIIIPIVTFAKIKIFQTLNQGLSSKWQFSDPADHSITSVTPKCSPKWCKNQSLMVKCRFIFGFRQKNNKFVANAFLAQAAVDRTVGQR